MRVAGIRVGTVSSVSLQPNNSVLVKFDADGDVALTMGTKAAIRYLNLVGDRYLELVIGPGSTKILPPGSHIPADQTTPALDLDLLLGGLKPVIRGLNPRDVNALAAAMLQVFRGSRPDPSVAAVENIVVLQRSRQQKSGRREADRQPQHSGGNPCQRRKPVLRCD